MDEKKFQFEISYFKPGAWKYIDSREEKVLQNQAKSKPTITITKLKSEDQEQNQQHNVMNIAKNQQVDKTNLEQVDKTNLEQTELNQIPIILNNQIIEQQENNNKEQEKQDKQESKNKRIIQSQSDEEIQKKLSEQIEQQCEILSSVDNERIQIVSTISSPRRESQEKQKGFAQKQVCNEQKFELQSQSEKSDNSVYINEQSVSTSQGNKKNFRGKAFEIIDSISPKSFSQTDNKQQFKKLESQQKEKIQIEIIGKNIQWSNKKDILRISCFRDLKLSKLIQKLEQSGLCGSNIELTLSENGLNVLNDQETIQHYGIITGWRLFAFRRLPEDLSITDSKLGFKVTS